MAPTTCTRTAKPSSHEPLLQVGKAVGDDDVIAVTEADEDLASLTPCSDCHNTAQVFGAWMMMFFGSHTLRLHPRLHRQHHQVAQVQAQVPAQASAATSAATEDDEQEDQFGGHASDDNDESALVTASHCVQQMPKLLIHDQTLRTGYNDTL